jgi:hypothetical protein
MRNHCPRCSRLNPPEARYCHHDGLALGGAPARPSLDPARAPFPSPLVFPSGRSCQCFDEIVLAVHDDWPAARDLLREGALAAFLGGLGRADLVLAAREAANNPDPDLGLSLFLARLPSGVFQPPRLKAGPSRFDLGHLRPGHDRHLELELGNEGMGLVTGTAHSGDCPWLLVDGASGPARSKLIRFTRGATLPVTVLGAGLRGQRGPLEARLFVESPGGSVEIPVTGEVPVVPYPDGVLRGATTPRQAAEKAKAQPREAAELFARGGVARWYEANGWDYPVEQPAASGLAAIQQFFEALGLTVPPKVALSPSELRFRGGPGETLPATLQVTTAEKKPVYATARSDQPWLVVEGVDCEGRQATIRLSVPRVPAQPGATLYAWLTVVANGRRSFLVPVKLSIAATASPRPRA